MTILPDLPADLVAFMQSGRMLSYDPGSCEAGSVRLRSLEKLFVELFPMDLQGSELEPDDPHRGELGCYLVPAVNLVEEAERYEATGLLVWLPREGRYGTWDSSHPWIAVFTPATTWSLIEAAPAQFLNAQWQGAFSDAAPTSPLIPWPQSEYRTSQIFEPVSFRTHEG